jgi:hypothetical protein
LINISHHIGGPIGLAGLLTVANFGTANPTDHLILPVMTMVTGFDYAFLAASLLTEIGIIFAYSFKQARYHQDKI